MITTYEVGSVFRIIDEASPALERIAKLAQDVDAQVELAKKNLQAFGRVSLAGISTRFTKTADAIVRGATTAGDSIARMGKMSEETAGVFAASMGAMNADIKMAIANMDALTASFRTASAAGAKVGLAGAPATGARAGVLGGAVSRGRGGAHGSFVTEGVGVPLPGGVRGYVRGHSHMGTAGLIGGGALAYGVYEQAKLEDAIFQMKWHAGLPNTPENDRYFRDLIQSTAARTGIDYRDIAEAATDEIRLLKGAEGKESGGLAILPEMLRAAAVEMKVKPGTTLQTAMRSLVEQAHMAQEYGIEDIKGMAPLLAFLSTTNPATMKQMTSAASYAMPTLHTSLAVDPADVLYETTALARAGATNTKSGTWVRAAFERLLPPDRRVVGKNEYARRMFAMREMGLVDENGKSTVMDPTGMHLDLDKAKKVVREHAELLPIDQRSAYMKKVFGEQGQRGMSLLMSPAVVAQEAELKKEFPEFKQRYATFFEDYSRESPIQKARETWMDMTNVLADIGQYVLPPLLTGLRGLDEILKMIAAKLPKQGEPFGPPAKGSLGEALGKGMSEGALIGAPIGAALGWLGGPFAPVSVPAGLAIGAAYGAVLGGIYEGGRYLLGTGDLSLTTPAGAAERPDSELRAAWAPRHDALAPWPEQAPMTAPGAGGFGALKTAAAIATSTNTTHATFDVTVKAETDDPETLAHKIATLLSGMLARATEHNQGGGDGVLSSPYTSGAAYP